MLESHLEDDKYFYEIDPFVEINKPDIKILRVQNTDLIYSDEVDINYDEKKDVLTISQKKKDLEFF